MGHMPRLTPLFPLRRAVVSLDGVGTSLRDVERDLVLETLSHTRGNRTAAAHLLGISVRTLRNKIVEYSAEGIYVPRHESHDEILAQPSVLLFRPRNRQSL
jgi:hypothetical protein